MTISGPPERRFRPQGPAPTPRCRLCWRAFDLDRRLVEPTDLHVYVRCPHCGGSFPVRHGDVADGATRPEAPGAG